MTRQKNDSKKSKEATLISIRIESCVRTGGKEGNSRLEQLLEKAKSLNVQKSLIERAIKRGSGELTDASQQQEVQYEFMGPGGVAVMVNALTDNKARTVSLVKNAMAYFQASLSSCAFMFDKKVRSFSFQKMTKKHLMMYLKLLWILVLKMLKKLNLMMNLFLIRNINFIDYYVKQMILIKLPMI